MPNKQDTGCVRIIAGRWRGRKIHFPTEAGLRPTSDRIRETLFNWLAPIIHNARCLDLFAGSGALGFEALSRGAQHVTFIEKNPTLIKHLQATAQLLQFNNLSILTANFPQQLPTLHQVFDIVFLDPPFHKGLIQLSCNWLQQNKLLADDAHIYIEAESELKHLPLPDNWELLRSKVAGHVGYHLASFIPKA